MKREVKLMQGQRKARILGLTSRRFNGNEMSEHAEQAMNSIKLKDRPELKLEEWGKRGFWKGEVIQELWNCPDMIPREKCKQLGVKQFVEKYERQNLPVVIEGCTEEWNPASKWTFEHMYRNYKEARFKVGEDDDGCKLRVPLKYYFEYLVYNKDDSPLYLFQSSLEDKPEFQDIIRNYQVPAYFRDDLLGILGTKKRPPFRWLLMGPERSGSTVHIDPLATSAWNASLVGHKRWVLFSEDTPKSIVKGKQYRHKQYEDEAINYFSQILPQIRKNENTKQIRMIEFIQNPGDVVFVPGGWWHSVINLDNTMAVTQNVMTHTNFDKVWRSLRTDRRKLAKVFLSKLKENEQQLYKRALTINQIDNYEMGNKYPRQSVSMSFTSSSQSSSSSSSQSESLSKQQSSHGNNLVKKNRSQRSHSLSRSREKKKHHTLSEEKTVNNGKCP